MKPVATKGNEIPFHTNPRALVRQGVSPGLCGSAMALLATPINVRETGKTQFLGIWLPGTPEAKPFRPKGFNFPICKLEYAS